jgi:uncharacterized protein (DUF1697 family)
VTSRVVALLRGINVGGKKSIAMWDLREALGGLGYTDVRTYLQSGNAILSCPPNSVESAASDIE